jgi:hypothetical protein
LVSFMIKLSDKIVANKNILQYTVNIK